MSLLRVSDLTLSIHDAAAEAGSAPRLLLNRVNLSVDAGETVGLVGESGSGKSLTARTAIALLPQNGLATGNVSLGEINMLTADRATAQDQRRNVASMVFQDPRSGLNPVRRIGDYVTEALRLCHGWSQQRATARATELLAEVGLPNPERHLRQYPHEFSGGMLQRVMIAAALSTEPKLLLCDEPTTALDVTTQAEIIGILTEQQARRGMGMLFITHDLNLAAAICDRVYVMKSGEIVEHGAAGTVLTNPREEYTRKLLAATPTLVAAADRPVPADRASAADRAATSHAPVPADISGPADLHAPSAKPILVIENLKKTYATKFGAVVAVDDVSFTVNRGAAFGVVGESGSGKSTIARLLVGLEHADGGVIDFDGQPRATQPKGKDERLARAKSIQIVFQDPYLSLDPRVPIGKAVEDVLALHFGTGKAERRSEALALLEQVGLAERQARALPRTLSGGQRQRAAIAKALAVSPQLLVLDEATSALDVSVQSQILQLINTVRAERGLSLVFVSHDLAVVQQICDETLVLRKGTVMEQGPTTSLLQNPRSAYTRLLVDSVSRAGWNLGEVLAARRHHHLALTTIEDEE